MALSKERLEGLIARSSDIVVATDATGKVAYYNDGAKRTLGYPQDEILGEFVAKLYPSLDEARRVMAAMRDPGYGGRGIVETFQTTYVSKNGEHIPVAISGTISYDERGEEDGTIRLSGPIRQAASRARVPRGGTVGRPRSGRCRPARSARDPRPRTRLSAGRPTHPTGTRRGRRS